MVIPNIPLPVAGNVSPSQPGVASVAGDGEGATASTTKAGGLFAALLVTLEGVAEDPVASSAELETTTGEEVAQNAPLLALLSVVDEADIVEDADIVHGAVRTPAKSADIEATVPVARSAVVKVAVATPQSSTHVLPTSTSAIPTTTPALPTPTAPPPTAEQAPVTGGDVVKPAPTRVDPSTQIGRPVNVEALAVARVPLPAEVVPVQAGAVPVQAGAVPVQAGAVPVQTEVVQEAPLLTGVKGPAPTVPVVSVEQARPVTQLSEPLALDPVVHVPAKHTGDSVAIAKSEPEDPVPIDFEKAKESLSVLRVKDESPSTSLRKAIAAFAKPVAGHSDGVANAPRLQTQAFVAVTAGESTITPVADVSRVAPTIAPAELGADAPKTVAAPETPERPARTTLPDLAKTAVRSVRYMARNGEHRMTLRLIPESLGEIHIEVLSTKEALSVKLVAESVVVRDAMESQAHLLRDSLSQEGLDVRNISISEESGSGRGAFNQRDANASRNGERGQSQSGQPSAPDQSSESNAKYATPRARHEGAFDQVA